MTPPTRKCAKESPSRNIDSPTLEFLINMKSARLLHPPMWSPIRMNERLPVEKIRACSVFHVAFEGCRKGGLRAWWTRSAGKASRLINFKVIRPENYKANGF